MRNVVLKKKTILDRFWRKVEIGISWSTFPCFSGKLSHFNFKSYLFSKRKKLGISMGFKKWKNVYQIDGNSEFLKFKEKIRFQVKKTFTCVKFVVLKRSEVFLTETDEIKKSGRRSTWNSKVHPWKSSVFFFLKITVSWSFSFKINKC